MEIIQTTALMVERVNQWRSTHKKIALIPTMGNLHAGHLALVKNATVLADRVVVSIFVNPLQFNNAKDYECYPRTLENDLKVLAPYNIAAVFAPSISEIYSQSLEQTTQVSVPILSNILEGAYRPRHFQGVTTIIAKLFNITQPKIALFGEKDYQQLLIIRRMVLDLAIPVTIKSISTVRDSNGLALSSRNSYLSDQERTQAPFLFNTLDYITTEIKKRKQSFIHLEQEGYNLLANHGFQPDYVSIKNMNLLDPNKEDRNLIVLGAAYLGKTRLIDNIPIQLG
ncbi:pantoate--beta-alanine ligase [Candidatus Nitrosacidococcus tergens]|uniref:Pantothenate synthetase n=1 Tax=Candidatus Nitrosacidococcus tergens TaxID=553981 RepID=A0A7G1QAZ3_9GAMM|nr:pantoate--beta-alanine ligase [Candidatus Nitrosacidococcus tergens]CAB1276356.1 pantothenate synthetase [Candidatus Nitrosacidococcus tergens]